MFTLRNRYSDLDEAIDDYSTWFVNNRPRHSETNVRALEQQIKFLSLAVDGSLFLIHMLRDELRKTQQKSAVNSGLWLPVSYR